MGFRAFKMCAPRLFNRLPIHVKNSPTVETFKKKLKTFLFTDAYDMSDMTVVERYAV